LLPVVFALLPSSAFEQSRLCHGLEARLHVCKLAAAIPPPCTRVLACRRATAPPSPPPGHEESVEAVGFSRHLPLAASAGMDGKLIIWDANGWTQRGVCDHHMVRVQEGEEGPGGTGFQG
jgi:WD40 repeat protein